MGLLSAQTKNPRACRLPGRTEPPVILTFAAQLARFLQDEVLLYASKAVRGAPLVVSPYVGGVLMDHVELMQKQATKRRMSCNILNVATQNPGRIGLTALGSTEILFWRLWAISNELVERDVHICVLPGARFPLGARLPDDFPYVWYGTQSSGWDGTGILCRVDMEHCVHPMDEYGSARHCWLALWPDAAKVPAYVVCGFGATPQHAPQ